MGEEELRAAAGTGAGSGWRVGRRARAYAGGAERVRERERERYERSKKDAGEGLRESWAFKWAFFSFFSLFMTTHIFFSFKYLYIYYSSPRKTPSTA